MTLDISSVRGLTIRTAAEPVDSKTSPVATIDPNPRQSTEEYPNRASDGCCHHNKLAMAMNRQPTLPLFAEFLEPLKTPKEQPLHTTQGPAAKSPSDPMVTTMAVGEEDDSCGPPTVTTMAIGEEDDGGDCSKPPICEAPIMTTLALGEDDDVKSPCHPKLPTDDCGPPVATTLMVGEEDDTVSPPDCGSPIKPEPPVATTLMVGEEDDHTCHDNAMLSDFFKAFDSAEISAHELFRSIFFDLNNYKIPKH